MWKLAKAKQVGSVICVGSWTVFVTCLGSCTTCVTFFVCKKKATSLTETYTALA